MGTSCSGLHAHDIREQLKSLMRNQMNTEDKCYDEFLRADVLWDKGEHRKAFLLLRKLVDQKYVHAIHNLGYFYDEGIGTKKNVPQALGLYKRAWAIDRQTDSGINIAKAYAALDRPDLQLRWLRKLLRFRDSDVALEYLKLMRGSARTSTIQRCIALCNEALSWSNATPSTKEEIFEIGKVLQSLKPNKNS